MKHGFVPSLACSVPPLSLFLAWLSLSLLLSMERNLHLPCGEQSIGGIRFASAVTATATTTTTTTTNARVKHRSRACAHPRADRSDASVSNLEDRIVATVRSNITSTRTSTSTSTSNNCDDACHTRRTDEEVPRSDREHDGGGWLCLRSTNARGRVSLRTLCEHRGTHESSSTIHPSECRMARDSDSDHESLESVWCWQPARINVTASNGEETIPPRSSANETDLSCSTATDVEDDAEDTILSGSTGIEVTRHKHKREREQKHIQSGPRLRSRTMDLLFATKHVRNQEISLPLSIAELFRQQQEHQQQSPHTVAPLPTDKNTSSLSLSPSPSPSPDPRSSSLAGPGVDLTGRWRPAAQGTDPEAYDAFLVACCSDVVSSYWTRRLLVSSSIVSRQELIVEQSEKGRVLRLVDVHPLASEAWNRTVVATLGGGDGILTRTHNANRLIDPQGDPILVEAFWQDHGRVHTTVTRKAANGDNEDEAAATSGWWHVHMYLQTEAKVEEHPANGYHETDPALMVVETTHHSTAFPSDAERVALHTRWEGTAECENAAKCKRTRKHKHKQDTDTATRMVWRWERVPEPAH